MKEAIKIAKDYGQPNHIDGLASDIEKLCLKVAEKAYRQALHDAGDPTIKGAYLLTSQVRAHQIVNPQSVNGLELTHTFVDEAVENNPLLTPGYKDFLDRFFNFDKPRKQYGLGPNRKALFFETTNDTKPHIAISNYPVKSFTARYEYLCTRDTVARRKYARKGEVVFKAGSKYRCTHADILLDGTGEGWYKPNVDNFRLIMPDAPPTAILEGKTYYCTKNVEIAHDVFFRESVTYSCTENDWLMSELGVPAYIFAHLRDRFRDA